MPYQPDFKEIDKLFEELNIQFSANGYIVGLPDFARNDIKIYWHSVLAVECARAYEEGRKSVKLKSALEKIGKEMGGVIKKLSDK